MQADLIVYVGVPKVVLLYARVPHPDADRRLHGWRFDETHLK